MKKALSPVRRRVRIQHGLTGLCWGLLLLAASAAAILTASFFLPMENRSMWLAAALILPPCAACVGLLLPVSFPEAAHRADACGLRERAQTAWALRERQDDMARLQREDAVAHLQKMNLPASMPLRVSAKILIAAGVCLAAALALFFLPNPQDDVLRQRADLRQRLEKPAQAMEKAADKLADAALDEKTAQELRRLLGDLARETRQARDAREALSEVSQSQQRMEKLLDGARSAAAEAVGQAGLDALAQALTAADQSAIAEALDSADADALADALNEAANGAENAAASAALQAAAQALSQGGAAQAAQALGQLSLSGLSSGQVAAALQSAKAAAAGGSGSGQGQGSGSGSGAGQGQGKGQGAGGGAGQGSTNEDAGSSAGGGSHTSGSGSAPSRYNLGQYEQIYDPTRLGDGGQISQSTGRVDENAQISELTLGPGLGNAAGSVPYDQVVGEYQAAAVQRAREAALPGYAQQWVADYFTALTE